MLLTIQDILAFAKNMVGIKYILWTGKEDTDIFYCSGIPSQSLLNDQGVNCAGLINIVRQYSGLTIPNNIYYQVPRGGTHFWYLYFKSQGVLQNIDYSKKYPLGSLFLRDYHDLKDQGHLAILFQYNNGNGSGSGNDNDNGNINSLVDHFIIHSYYEDSHLSGGVNISKFDNLRDGKDPYYQYIILPENWLSC